MERYRQVGFGDVANEINSKRKIACYLIRKGVHSFICY